MNLVLKKMGILEMSFSCKPYSGSKLQKQNFIIHLSILTIPLEWSILLVLLVESVCYLDPTKVCIPSILSTFQWKYFCYFGGEAPFPFIILAKRREMPVLFPFLSPPYLLFQFPLLCMRLCFNVFFVDSKHKWQGFVAYVVFCLLAFGTCLIHVLIVWYAFIFSWADCNQRHNYLKIKFSLLHTILVCACERYVGLEKYFGC